MADHHSLIRHDQDGLDSVETSERTSSSVSAEEFSGNVGAENSSTLSTPPLSPELGC